MWNINASKLIPPSLTRLAGCLALAILGSCAPSYTLVSHSEDRQILDETFPYRKWLREGHEPTTVVIGLHGFSGASIDYENLAHYLMKEQPGSALYAYEVRGQGRDPKKERRGDIDDPANWSHDLLTFTRLIRQQHPKATVVWMGESMGGLILAHTYREQIEAGSSPPCDALAISSPVVKIRDDFPLWKKELVRGISKLAPSTRISLESLTGGEKVQMTEDSFHSDQSETNSWHVETHTLRLLVTLGDMIEDMPECAETFQSPTLVLHGGKDFFTTQDDVKSFMDRIPETTPEKRLYYPKGHHLLMYDHIKDDVITDIADWLESLNS
ncbi:MAG: alpha/beta fold hydrolase [Verrucomicrobiales bacterium]